MNVPKPKPSFFSGVGRNIYLLGFLSLFNDLTGDMITPLLPAYLASLGVGASFLGAMEGVSNSLAHMTTLISGRLSDRFGKNKKLTVFGYALCAFVRPLIAVPIPGVILAARWVDRIGKGIRTAPRDQLLTASVDRKLWGRAFGIHRSLDHAGALIAPLVAAWLLRFSSLKLSTVFLIACLPSIISVLILPRWVQETGTGRPSPLPKLSWKNMTPALRRYVLVIFVSALSTPSELFMLLRMQTLGMAQYQIPLAWLLLTGVTLVATNIGGYLTDHWSKRRTIAVGWTFFALVYLAFAFNTSLLWGWILIGLYGLHMGLIEAPERVYAASIVPETERATALGWYNFAYGLGLLPASVLFGILWDHAGPGVAFGFNAILTCIAIGMISFLPSDRKNDF